MESSIYNWHLKAGKEAGEESTCGKKNKFDNEEKAIKAAASHNKWSKRNHNVEHYPCYFCHQWHLGRIFLK